MSENNDAKIYYNKGTLYNSEGKFGLAVDNFKKALEFEPDSIEILFNLGVALINKKDFEPAIECFKKVIEMSPEEVAAYSNIALAYAKHHDYSNAIINYKKAMELDTSDTSTFKDLGDVYTKDRQYDLAIENYNKYLELNPHSAVVKESLKTAINLRKNAQPQVAVQPPVNTHVEITAAPSEANAERITAESCFIKALNLIKEQKFDDAIENLRTCLKIDSKYPNAYDTLNKLFKIKERMGNSPAPQQAVPKPADSPPPKAQSTQPAFIDYMAFNQHFTLAVAYFNVGNDKLALENFKKCQEINPSDTSTANYISQINERANKINT